MANLGDLVRAGRAICAIGFDDAPFERRPGGKVNVGGVVCSGTRFEGLLWGAATVDGTDGTATLIRMLSQSKFASQVHVVLTDGLTIGGLNVLDLAELHAAIGKPCIAVMRKPPDRMAMRRAIDRVPHSDARWATLERGGPVHEEAGFVFQVVGADPSDAVLALSALTDRGKVPEPLRLAHLIGSAVLTGQSSRRA